MKWRLSWKHFFNYVKYNSFNNYCYPQYGEKLKFKICKSIFVSTSKLLHTTDSWSVVWIICGLKMSGFGGVKAEHGSALLSHWAGARPDILTDVTGIMKTSPANWIWLDISYQQSFYNSRANEPPAPCFPPSLSLSLQPFLHRRWTITL